MERTKRVGAGVAALLLAGFGGCTERTKTPDPEAAAQTRAAALADAKAHAEAPAEPLAKTGPAPETAPGTLVPAEPEAAARAEPEAAPAPAAAPPPLDLKDLEGDLLDFSGFSRDESLFAFTRYAEAAGLHLLTVVEGTKGEVKHRFQLMDEGSTEQARAFLRERGFSRREGNLPEALRDRLQLRVQDGKAKVVLLPKARGGQTVLYEGDPFAQPNVASAVKSVEKGMVSPSGRKLALRVEQVPVTEWGGIVSYIIVDVESAPGAER